MLVFSFFFLFQRPLFRSTPPLPYRIAKALDPDFFRNVELDIIQEEKRGKHYFSKHQPHVLNTD